MSSDRTVCDSCKVTVGSLEGVAAVLWISSIEDLSFLFSQFRVNIFDKNIQRLYKQGYERYTGKVHWLAACWVVGC